MWLIDLYGLFLQGQVVSESMALRAEAAIAVLRMVGTPERDLPDALDVLNAIHAAFLEIAKVRRQ